uniref:AIG1-type G domain-containing protein n=1 Tax=Brassica oleracea var. oleracea TaxID=109376 RepID=A0A0D3B1E3_BRAOL
MEEKKNADDRIINDNILIPPAPPVLGLGRGAPLLKPTPRRRVNGNVLSQHPTTTTAEIDETRVKFLRLSHRLGQTPRNNVVVAQFLYRLGLPELSRGSSRGVGAFISSINRAISMAEQLEGQNQDHPLDFSCTIMLLGKTGVGKSATINSIFDDDHEVKKMCTTDAFQMGTKRVQLVEGFVQGIKVRVIDTPGLSPSWLDTQTQSIDDDMLLLRTITHVLGPSIWSNAIVGLTHAASAPPDGAASSYDMFVTRRCLAIQLDIRQAARDLRLVNPVSLVENHPACRTNRAGHRVLPNGQAWKPHLLLL